MSKTAQNGVAMELVERESVLQTLQGLLRSTALRGQVALVAGEAGIGKTSVLRVVAADWDNVWWGACDALQTPHPLAPLLDIARNSRPRFAAQLAGPRPATGAPDRRGVRPPLAAHPGRGVTGARP